MTLLGGMAAWPFAAQAQQLPKVARIGYLGSRAASGMSAYVEAFRAGLRDLGYVEGKNIVIEFRWADGNYDRLPALAAELVHMKLDVLLADTLPSALAAKQATTMIPIVMASSTEPVRLGLIASLNRPGGNVTGNTTFNPEVSAKRIELLKEALPGSSQIAVLFNPGNSNTAAVLEKMETSAKGLNVELEPFPARQPDEFAEVVSQMKTRRIDGIVIVDDPMLIANATRICELLMDQRLPSIGFLELVEAGGLMAYGVDYIEMWRHTAVFVDKILKGAKPDELPVEQPTRFKFVINLKTANALGLTLPYMLSGRADEVIE
jgi:putative ABC transport system substrate-binding protein